MNQIVERTDNDILIKNSGAINIVNDLNSTQRKAWNAMLFEAYQNLLTHEEHEAPLALIREHCGYKNKNYEDFRTLIQEMQRVTVEGDVFNRVDENWSSVQLLGDVAFTNEGMIRWNYSKKLREALSSPKIYARINLRIQKVITGKFTMPLWECFVDILGARRNDVPVRLKLVDIRKIVPVGENQYTQFKDFKRYVLIPAFEEINEKCEVEVRDIVYTKTGRRTTGVSFTLSRKKGFVSINDFHDKRDFGDIKTLANRISLDFDLSEEEGGSVLGLVKDKPDPLEYLQAAYEYVVEQNNLGKIKTRVGRYFIGVLKKGFANPKQISDAAKAEKLKTDDRDRKAAKARIKFSTLDEGDKKAIIERFRETLNQSLKISLDANGLESDEHLNERLGYFLVREFRVSQ